MGQSGDFRGVGRLITMTSKFRDANGRPDALMPLIRDGGFDDVCAHDRRVSRNLAGVQIGDGENEVVVVPVDVATIERPVQEQFLVEILPDCGVVRLAEKRLEINDRHMSVVERDLQFVSTGVLDAGDFQVGCLGAHLSFLVMISVLTSR